MTLRRLVDEQDATDPCNLPMMCRGLLDDKDAAPTGNLAAVPSVYRSPAPVGDTVLEQVRKRFNRSLAAGTWRPAGMRGIGPVSDRSDVVEPDLHIAGVADDQAVPAYAEFGRGRHLVEDHL
jgi:hypothetical protein